MARYNSDKVAGVLVSSMVAALVVFFIGDAFTYEEGDNVTIGFKDTSATGQIIGIAPLIVVALGLYGAFRKAM